MCWVHEMQCCAASAPATADVCCCFFLFDISLFVVSGREPQPRGPIETGTGSTYISDHKTDQLCYIITAQVNTVAIAKGKLLPSECWNRAFRPRDPYLPFQHARLSLAPVASCSPSASVSPQVTLSSRLRHRCQRLADAHLRWATPQKRTP